MRFLSTLFFLSGAAGLMYEVVWARLLADALGSTALSLSVVFSVFLLALATGGLAVGRTRIERVSALQLYGWLEIGVAVLAALATGALLAGRAEIAVRSPGPEHFAASLAYAFAVSAAVIGPPTLLMGGTLPAVLRAVRSWDLPHRAVARLYGWNTVGAGVGTAAAGFVLIWQVGLTATVAVAVGLNLTVGAVALARGRVRSPERAQGGTDSASGDGAEPAPPDSGHGRPDAGWGRPNPDQAPPDLPGAADEPRGARAVFWLLAFLSGFTVLAYEILWGRLSRFLLGDRTLAVTTLLAAFIAALGVASFVAHRVGERQPARGGPALLTAVGIALLASALLHVGVVTLADRTIHGSGLASLPLLSTPVFGRVVTVALLIVPPVLALGAVFPLLARGAPGLDRRPGRVVGDLYFVNTLGAASGALAATYVLSRGVGTYGGFIVLTAGTAVLGTAVLMFAGTRRLWTLAGGVVALVAVALLPRSLHYVRPEESLLLAHEDEYGVQALVETDWGALRVRNNRLSLIFDLGHPQTAHAQQMPAHLTTLLAGNARSVLNVGTGYGITAGTYTLYPDVLSVRTVEILPFLVENQDYFGGHNFGYAGDPRVTLVQGDGRHALAASADRYDIISVNVLDPYLPGSSSLYTVEFWELVRSRLLPGGVFTQLFWGEDLGLLIRGLEGVFPSVLYFPAYGGTSYNVVAFEAPQLGAPTPILSRLGPAAAEAIRAVTGAEPSIHIPRIVAEAWAGREHFHELGRAAEGPLHTDDRPILEFRWAHGVSGVSVFDSPLVQY